MIHWSYYDDDEGQDGDDGVMQLHYSPGHHIGDDDELMMMAIVSCIIPVYTVENPLTVSVSSSPVCDNTAHKEAER